MAKLHQGGSDGVAPQDVDRPPSPPVPSAAFKSQRTATCTLVNLVGIMERMDEQVLPAASSFVACAFKIGPADLGSITFYRAVVQALASPFGGVAGHYFDRIQVIFAGCSIWGLCTFLFGLSDNVYHGRLVWAFNGIGLSLIIPNSQSLIADYYPSAQRGTAFGLLYLTGSLGGMMGALYATNIGHLTILGIQGWRFSFISVAVVSWLVGLATLLFGRDPRRAYPKRVAVKRHHAADPKTCPVEEEAALLSDPCTSGGSEQRSDPQRNESDSALEPSPLLLVHVVEESGDIMIHPGAYKGPLWPRFVRMLLTPTFLLIIFQGVIGTMPWNGMVFFTLYFQLLGMGNFGASILMSVLLAGSALGCLLGGWIGDKAALHFPNSGRIGVTQFSVVAGIPLSFLLIWGLPSDGGVLSISLYAIVLFVFGLIISWPAPACNNPIFAEIVPEDMRNLVYAFDRSFEGALSAMSAFLVGWTAENWFGFKGDATANCDDPSGDIPKEQIDSAKAQSLGDAMLLFMVVPWALCAIIYTGLYWTYPRDKARVNGPTHGGSAPSGGKSC